MLAISRCTERLPGLHGKAHPKVCGRPKTAKSCLVRRRALNVACQLQGSKATPGHNLLKTPSAISVDAPTVTETSTAPESSAYVWTKNWWPLIPVDYLDPKKPKAMTLLGMQLVLWKDGEGQWRVFKDACPHRLAPLSEGRVEPDGTLLCSYHAWRFNGEGKCTTIPQSVTQEAEANACNSKRSCAFAFPTKEDVGLLWVWPDDSDTRWIESAASPAVVSNIIRDSYTKAGKVNWYMRDVPYGYEVLVENVTDPAHVPVSHHKLSANLSRYKLTGITMTKTFDPSYHWASYDSPAEPVFSIQHNFTPLKIDAPCIVKFTAPGHVQLGAAAKETWINQTSLYCVPVKPGQARVLHSEQFNPDVLTPKGFLPSLMYKVRRWVFRGIFTPLRGHQFMTRLFDGDGVFLNMQQTTLQQQHAGNWRKAYYLPASCDASTASVRSWMDKVGPPLPMESVGAQGPVDRRILLDRYDSHTKHCPLCLAEVKRLSNLIQAAKVVAAAAFLAACFVAGSEGWRGLVTNTVPFVTKAGAAVVALLATALWSATKWLSDLQAAKQEFFFTDWVHAERD